MKSLVRIFAWTLIALVIQQSIFLFIEKVYLNTDVNITAEKVEEDDDDSNKNQTTISLKPGTGDVLLSDNARYVAYKSGNILKVLDSNDNSEKTFNPDTQGEIVYYSWLTNESNMIVIQKIRENGMSYFVPVSYNVKKGETHNITDFDKNEVKIQVTSAEDKVADVDFSTATSTLYVKITKSNGKSDLYSSNIMNQMQLVRKNVTIGNIVVPTTNTNCVMEMGNSVTILNSSSNIQIPGVTTAKLLGTDMNDNVYIGNEVNGKINKIYYKVITDTNSKWSSYTLSKPSTKENIKVDYYGKIFVNDSDALTVSEITGGSTIKYEGKFIQVYSDGIISRSGNKLIKNVIEDKRLVKNK